MTAIKVYHLTDRLSARGGADRHLLGVLQEQVSRGYDVTLCVATDDGTAIAPCRVLRMDGLDSRSKAPVSLPAESASALIHVHNVMNPTAISLAHVMTVQDHRTFCPGRGKLTESDTVCRTAMSPDVCAGCFRDEAYFQRVLRATEARVQALRAVPRITVLSGYMRDELTAVGVNDAAVIPPFVHDLPQAERTGPPIVLFVGRVVAAKGVKDAVQAWRSSGLDVPLIIAGTGRQRGEIERDGVAVLGWLDRPALAALYARAAAVILPSRWQEPFGIVGLEALSRGVPVAAWESGGVADWHPGPLAAWGDVDGLAALLRQMVLHPPQHVAPAGDFDPNRLMDALEREYQKC